MGPSDEGYDDALDGAVSIEGRVKGLEILVLLLLQDAARDDRRVGRLMSSLRHLARELRAEDGEDVQVAYLLEKRTALLSRLAAKYRDEPFD